MCWRKARGFLYTRTILDWIASNTQWTNSGSSRTSVDWLTFSSFCVHPSITHYVRYSSVMSGMLMRQNMHMLSSRHFRDITHSSLPVMKTSLLNCILWRTHIWRPTPPNLSGGENCSKNQVRCRFDLKNDHIVFVILMKERSRMPPTNVCSMSGFALQHHCSLWKDWFCVVPNIVGPHLSLRLYWKGLDLSTEKDKVFETKGGGSEGLISFHKSPAKIAKQAVPSPPVLHVRLWRTYLTWSVMFSWVLFALIFVAFKDLNFLCVCMSVLSA